MIPYGKQFFEGQQPSSTESAKAIVPILIEYFRPTSVVDVGCGLGTWIKEFIDNGVVDVLGLDGPWVSPEMLLIPKHNFRSIDLVLPPRVERKFSLAVSVEVAEHLPKENAVAFVSFLTRLAPVVAFSAAIPGQGGTAHLNEEWQDYWCHLFKEFNYVPLDIVRARVWDDPKVCWWYAQNLIVYVDASHKGSTFAPGAMPLNIVHPLLFGEALRPENLPPSLVLRALPFVLKKFLRRLCGKN